MIANVDITYTAPDEYLPGSLIKLIAARDTAVEALQDFEDEWAHVLSDTFLATAEAADTQAAIAAARAGKDVTKLPSEVDKVRSLRPRIKGAHQVLASDVRTAENAVRDAYRPLAPTLEPKALAELRDRVAVAEQAYAAYSAAREAVGEATHLVNHLRDWATGGRSDFRPGGSNPTTAHGTSPNATEPVAALREVLRSFETGYQPDPLVLVEAVANGQRMELTESQAKALGKSVRIIKEPQA
ncbi:hypothetical protein [Streptomyces sp. NPDC047009]|uniref:hypothetical protein n=1 Tax=Streptomyces sp. NPDC047009 TaxID=3154496 RepID=UPI00340F143B